MMLTTFADLHMPSKEVVAIPIAPRKERPDPLVITSPSGTCKGGRETSTPRKQFLDATARAGRSLAHVAKEGHYMYLRARFKVRSQVYMCAEKRRWRCAEEAEAKAKERAEADEDADETEFAADGAAVADVGGGGPQTPKPRLSELVSVSTATVHVVGARSVNAVDVGAGVGGEGVGVSAYDVLLPPRMPWSEYFSIRTPSSSTSELGSSGPPTPSASGFFSPIGVAPSSASMSQSRSRSILGLRSERSTSIDPTCTRGNGYGWGAMLPLRFPSSKSGASDECSDALLQPDLTLPAFYASRAASLRLEEQEDEVAARIREEKKVARDRRMVEIESEMRKKKKVKARAERLRKDEERRVEGTNAHGWFQLE